MPKIISPSEKKVYGLSLKTRQLEKMHLDGFEEPSDWIDYLLNMIMKKDNVIRAMQDELDKLPPETKEPAIPISEIDKVKQLLQAKPEE